VSVLVLRFCALKLIFKLISGSIKNIHLSYFRNLKFVFSVLICSSSSLLYPRIRVRTAPPVSVRVRVRVSDSFIFTVLCLQRWRCIFLMCPLISGKECIVDCAPSFELVRRRKYSRMNSR